MRRSFDDEGTNVLVVDSWWQVMVGEGGRGQR